MSIPAVPDPASLSRLWLGLFGLLIGLLSIVAAFGPAAPPHPVAVVFPPWWDMPRAFAAVAAADGVVLGGGVASPVLIVQGAAGFTARLRRAGALLLLDPSGTGLCATPAGGTGQ